MADTPHSYLVATEKGETFWKTVIIFVLLKSLFSSGVMKSLTMFQLLTPVDYTERSTSSAPVFLVSATCYSAEPPESVLPSTTSDPSPGQQLRRSNRGMKAPYRLNL